MTTMPATIGCRSPEYMIGVYAPAPKKVSFESFSKVLTKSDINFYGTAATEATEIGEYIMPSTIKLESMYDILFPRQVLHQPKERSEPMQESISALKPEIVGLGLGGIISFGVGMFALATRDTGLAIVMAGPLLASILGSALLLISVRRKKQ